MKEASTEPQANSKSSIEEVEPLHHEINCKTNELGQTTDQGRIEFLVEDLKTAHKKLRRLSLS